ncbi:uncharacterized protein LOC126824974 [Patella vulgata]|uniref:uncharacterized protein LOC126824974 n=1 Tax=Patella vulgata TaxID=6465 RepID=UPI0024A9629A|nr:uncharacterized protein LOC126824974 [Patella vulgata]XP_055957514.1 uncharacterized protein LOC126824974 [Patella vulgata]XP_055957515.1 uncharacterized protein LOC126824974 [Patella vulgata]XP_055957516.1 uncharacterized protein LOC126824974 [Patella vulgata]XP_055957517.1 uncharacterized protein LOC126824974 [Patella vulgata]XP_055957518.1 uncharacterized protein LOC126824974 [Patella vulgata]
MEEEMAGKNDDRATFSCYPPRKIKLERAIDIVETFSHRSCLSDKDYCVYWVIEYTRSVIRKKMSLKVLLFVSLMGVTPVANGQGLYDLGNCTSFINDINQCMTEHQVLPDIINLVNAHLQNLHTLNASIVCSYMTEYISLITCIQDAIAKCLTDEFSSLFPTDKVITANVLYFCQNSADFDYKCMMDIGQENMKCISRNFNITDFPKRNEGFNKWKAYFCRLQEITLDCLIDQSTPESCQSTLNILKGMNRKIALPVCSKFRVTTDNPNLSASTDNPNANFNIDIANDDRVIIYVDTIIGNSVNINNNNVILFMVCLLIGVFCHEIYFPI